MCLIYTLFLPFLTSVATLWQSMQTQTGLLCILRQHNILTIQDCHKQPYVDTVAHATHLALIY